MTGGGLLHDSNESDMQYSILSLADFAKCERNEGYNMDSFCMG